MVSIEVDSAKSLVRLEFSNANGCLFEAEMGEIQRIRFADSSVLEVVFKNGALRIDISKEELAEELNDVLFYGWR